MQTGTADLQVSTAGIGGGAWNWSTATIVLADLIPGGAYKQNYDFSLWNTQYNRIEF